MLELARAGRSALLVAPTGAGKTLAGFLPTICDLANDPAEGLHTLYVSPLKALARRRPAQPARPDRGDGPADPRRNPQRRHAVRPQGAPAHPPAADPADHAEIAEPACSAIPTARPCSPASRPSSSMKSTPSPRKSAAICSASSLARLQTLRARPSAASASARPSPIPTPIAAGSRPTPTSTLVDLVEGDPGAEPDLYDPHPRRPRALVRPFGPLRRARR